MSFVQHTGPDVVSGEQYRYALTNFRIAHEKVEEQRMQLQEQEKQVAQLRARIALLEGTDASQRQFMKVGRLGSSSVDDFSIKNAASNLERMINQWAADVIRTPGVHLDRMRHAALLDIFDDEPPEPLALSAAPATGIQVQNLLRHAISDTVSESILNCLVITAVPDANIQLTRIHEHIFARDPTVAAVWRRQTFSAAVETCPPEMTSHLLSEHMSNLAQLLGLDLAHKPDGAPPVPPVLPVLEAALEFSRMLHGSASSSNSSADSFYRAFAPELGSSLNPQQMELGKRCVMTERGELDRVGATVFPGLVKVTRGPPGANGLPGEELSTVVRRAHVICECALTPPRRA